MRKLVCVLAVRNNGSRLYGKPLQNIDVASGYRIIDLIIDTLNDNVNVLDGICLAISEGVDNTVFIKYAEERNIEYVVGSEHDVLGRLIKGGIHCGATDILRITSESPFVSSEIVNKAWEKHISEGNDATFYDEVVDGCGFELLTLSSLVVSHEQGEEKHRSELCTLYIRENKEKFKVGYQCPEEHLKRYDLRLTVDNPEDLILCRAVYKEFSKNNQLITLEKVIDFLDQHQELKELVLPYTIEGYTTMYK